MTVLKNHGNVTEDKEQGYGAYVHALILDRQAKAEFPELESSSHLANVSKVRDEVESYLNFARKTNSRSSNYYENARVGLGGDVMGCGTALKFDFRGQRNFTPNDAKALYAHLKRMFPKMKINVVEPSTRPVCIVHVGL